MTKNQVKIIESAINDFCSNHYDYNLQNVVPVLKVIENDRYMVTIGGACITPRHIDIVDVTRNNKPTYYKQVTIYNSNGIIFDGNVFIDDIKLVLNQF